MTIKERAREYCKEQWDAPTAMRAYMDGATEQKAIDDAELLKLKSAWEKEAQINHDVETNYKQGYYDAVEKVSKFIDNYVANLAYPVSWADVIKKSNGEEL